MATQDAQKALSDEILEDARRRAERILAQANAAAEKSLADAKAEGKADADKASREAEARARGRADMMLRAVAQEVQRRMLLAREVLVKQVMAQAEGELDKIPSDEYRRALVRLAVDALRRMPPGAYVVRVAPAKEGEDAAGLAAGIAEALRTEGIVSSVNVEVDTSLSRGIIIESADGKLRWDNTFRARLRRLRPRMRRIIVPMLFEET